MIKYDLVEEFTKWLEEELRKRHWQPSDLTRAAHLGNSTLTRILNGIRKPGPDVCTAIAQALNESPEKVFRLAGLMPPLQSEDGPTLKEIIQIVKRMTEEDKEEVLDYARMRYEKRQKKKKPTKPVGAQAKPAPLVQRLAVTPKDIPQETAERVRAAVEKLTPDERAAWIEYLFYRRHQALGSQIREDESDLEASQPDQAAKPRVSQE